MAVRSFFADKDDGEISSFPIEPTFVVASANGDHAYFLLAHPISADGDQFRRMQKQIAGTLYSDHAVCDLPRVMRLPGFLHLKKPERPILVTIKQASRKSYSVSELEDVFFPPQSDRYKKWVAERPGHQGVRNNETLKIVREGLGSHQSEEAIAHAIADYCSRSGFDSSEAAGILERQVKQHGLTPFRQLFTKEKLNFVELAEAYLHETGLVDGSSKLLRSYKGEFFAYNGTHYVRRPREDLFNSVLRYFQNSPELRSRSVSRSANEVLKNLEAIVHVDSSLVLPAWLDGRGAKAGAFISLENGLLNIGELALDSAADLIPHSPEFFTLSSLPYAYQAGADCPTWLDFLEEVIPDSETRAVLQEWFGLCLVHDVTFQKFLMLYGDGANGKSVVCCVLRVLLGDANVTSVPLEAFDPGRTFPLSSMHGKLANIVEEVGSFQRTQEGILKQIVSGGSLEVEKKNRDGFAMVPTVRLTYASNLRPTFQDKSNGVWRRLLGIPMKNRIGA